MAVPKEIKIQHSSINTRQSEAVVEKPGNRLLLKPIVITGLS
jgi:hypothetical protein